LTQGQSQADPVLARLRSLADELGAPVRIEQPVPTRVDVYLTLPGAEETERLRHVGGDTFRVSLAHEDEIDGELTEWLRRSAGGRSDRTRP
jgi:hypothetical protein